MPPQSNGSISFSDVSQFISGSNNQISLNDLLVRLLLNDSSGPVSMFDAYSKPAPGSASYTRPGTYSFLVYPYSTISVEVLGAGGGGGGGDNHNIYGIGNCGYDGGNGGLSQFQDMIAYGGGYGGGNCSGHPGTNSGGTGGTVTVGGGSAGGHGGWPQQGSGNGYNGGYGGKTVKSWTWTDYDSDRPIWGTYITVIVGAGGAAAPQNAGYGIDGVVNISWS